MPLKSFPGALCQSPWRDDCHGIGVLCVSLRARSGAGGGQHEPFYVTYQGQHSSEGGGIAT